MNALIDRIKPTVRVALLVASACAIIALGSRITELSRHLRNEHVSNRIVYLDIAARPVEVVETWKEQDQLEPVTDSSLAAASRLSQAQRSLFLDAFLIPAYVIFFALGIHWLAGRLRTESTSGSWKLIQWLVPRFPLLTSIQPVIGLLDYVENFLLAKLLMSPDNPGLAQSALYVMYLKWTLLMITGSLVATAVAWLYRLKWGHFSRTIFFHRIPLLALVVILGLTIMGFTGPSMISNAWIVTGNFQAFFLGLCAVLSVAVCLSSSSVICHHGPRRFRMARSPGLERLLRNDRAGYWCIIIVISAPQLALVTWRSHSDNGLNPWLCSLSWIAGASLAAWIVRTSSGKLSRQFTELTHRLLSKCWSLMPLLKQGYVDAHGKLHRAHSQAGAALLIILVIYITGYLLMEPAWIPVPIPMSVVPTLGYVFWLLMLLTSLLSAVAFWLDRSRFPITTALVIWAFVTTNNKDHYFGLIPNVAAKPATYTDAQAKRLKRAPGSPRGPGKVITVVCSNGGGIQAAAWAAQVLEGLSSLDAPVGTNFIDSVQLFSSTSGGSVGIMYYLQAFPRDGSHPLATNLSRATAAAMASSLEETAWGLVYPDFLNSALPVQFWGDRAWATESAWRRRSDRLVRKSGHLPPEILNPSDDDGARPRLTLFSDWMSRSKDGTLPAVVFNSTETGAGEQHFLATITLPNLQPKTGTTRGQGYDLNARTFHSMYNRKYIFDMYVTTAARLSATFPYVTPTSRAIVDRQFNDQDVPDIQLPTWRLADGGYFDNSGLVAALAWIDSILERDKEANQIGELLLIQIDGFPVKRKYTPYGTSPGWIGAALDPVKTVLNVRTSSQRDRGGLELQILKGRYPNKLKSFVLRPDHEFIPDPPLSWHLSDADKAAIEKAWRALETNKQGQVAGIRESLSGTRGSP